MRKTRSPFEILGVSPADDITIIRMAWRAKVRLLHPDRATDKARATDQLAAVNAAFDALQGHVPTKPVKKPARPKSAKATAPEPTAASKAQRRPQRRREPPKAAEQKRSTPAASQETLARSNRARAGYARARDIIAA